MNPISVADLRGDWEDNPTLEDDDKAYLATLSDDTLSDALDKAFRTYEDMWLHIFDSVRTEATDALLVTESEGE